MTPIDQLTTDQIIQIVMIIAVVIGFIPLYFDFYQRRKERTPPVELEKFQEKTNSPLVSSWGIRIHPNRTMEHCKVLYDNEVIPYTDGDYISYDSKIKKDHTAIFRVPNEIQKEDALIKIMDGKSTVKKLMFSDIGLARR